MASLVASISLSLGIAVYSLAQKSLALSSLGRDSQLAFYAADTGAECALYWDMRNGLFSTSTPPANTYCDAQQVAITATPTGSGPSWTKTAFTFAFEEKGSDPSGYCVRIEVDKLKGAQPGTINTTIRSDGFSVPCGSVSSSQRALQRSVELSY